MQPLNVNVKIENSFSGTSLICDICEVGLLLTGYALGLSSLSESVLQSRNKYLHIITYYYDHLYLLLE